MRRLAVVVAMAGTLGAPAASAAGTDRLAVEALGDESPWDVAFAYERACWTLGADDTLVAPVQLFEFSGGRFVRLAVQGGELSVRCLEALAQPRRAVDGTVRWFDGFAGGVLLPDGSRVPDTDWYDPAAQLERAAPDAALVEALSRGDDEALQSTLALSAVEALATVQALTQRGTSALPSLEQLAAKHPHWRVRREALLALDSSLSFEALAARARTDDAWEVRHAAVTLVAAAAAGPLPMAAPDADKATAVLEAALSDDPDWRVRRQVIWQLSSATAARLSRRLIDLTRADPEPQVRAAALETLAGADLMPRGMAREALLDQSEVVRAVAAHVLTVLFEPGHAPLLWRALKSDLRPVRLAAAPMLANIDTRGLGPQLWTLYVEEANQVDARQDTLQVLGDALVRASFEPLGELLEARLSQTLAPAERRLAARLLSRAAPDRALGVLMPMAGSDDELSVSIAAHALPDTPDTRRLRFEWLRDDSALVRAGAVLGLCQVPGVVLTPQQRSTLALPPAGLGLAATMALPRCGLPEPERRFVQVRLEETPAVAAGGEGTGPAVAAMALVLLSVVGIRLSADRRPADGGADVAVSDPRD